MNRNIFFYTLITFGLLMSSCKISKIIKFSNNQDIRTISNSKIYFINENNRVILGDDINMLLDTGAPNCFFNKSKNNFYFSDSLKIGSLKDAFGKEIGNKLYICDWNNKLFNSKNLILRSVPFSFDCIKKVNGLIGGETFVDKILSLNFENNYIEILDKFEVEKSQYSDIEVSNFDGYFFDIYMTISKKKYSFRIDTGNNYDAILTKASADKIDPHYSSSFFKKEVQVSNFKDEAIFMVSKNIKNNLLGVNFLKNYNWILDYKKGKVYLKKINSINKIIYYNRCTIKQNTLVVNYSNLFIKSSQITSVNNTKVTQENICEMQDLLNNTEDWNTLKLEVISKI